MSLLPTGKDSQQQRGSWLPFGVRLRLGFERLQTPPENVRTCARFRMVSTEPAYLTFQDPTEQWQRAGRIPDGE